jgi:2-oxoisovalerate dehydrogenase E1 component beta subunit
METQEKDTAATAGTVPMTMIQALRSGLDVMMERDDDVIVYGQDVGYFGGVFRVTEGLQAKYGKSRCFDAPISEGGIVGTAVGMGAYGLRPVVEIQFADYFYPAMDQIVSEAARLRHRSAGDFTAPLTIRMPCGGGIYGGQTHSQSPEAIFTHVCGLRTVMPSNPYDAKGLLIASIEKRRPGHLPGAQAPLTTARSTATTTARSCPGPSMPWAWCPRATTRCRSTAPPCSALARPLRC